jgi:hypothetical protein
MKSSYNKHNTEAHNILNTAAYRRLKGARELQYQTMAVYKNKDTHVSVTKIPPLPPAALIFFNCPVVILRIL